MAKAQDGTSAQASAGEVKVRPAKGRPMLTWVGKRSLTRVPAYPGQHIETFDPTGALRQPPADPNVWRDWPAAYPAGGLLFHGDNKEVLGHLLANGFRGKVDLIYIDPPFDSGADYVRRVQLRGLAGTERLDGESYTLDEQIQYTDIWANDNYLQFMYERLLLLKELLADQGSLWLHSGWQKNHHLRCLLDEVFGGQNLRDEVIWHYKTSSGAPKGTLIKNHATIYHYTKGDDWIFNGLKEPWPEDTLKKWQTDDDGRIYRVQNKFGKRYYIDPDGKNSDDVWEFTLASRSSERLDYPTQKPESLLERIIQCSSGEGDIVLDCFIGSGTTAAVAQELGRRWIGCDINRGAVQVTTKRLQTIIHEQVQNRRLVSATSEDPEPTQVAFTLWRVNDYDLQIQHNEAVNLACDFIGVERMRSDPYFDGTLHGGRTLVKVVPFNHPLTPLDLEELKRELDARPDEVRPITLVSLGIELQAKAWIEDWNRLRKGTNAANRIDVIELRTDQRYGGVIRHEPARAKVSVRRENGRVRVEIEDFVSPTIVQRLQQQGGVLSPQIDDWRAMVDSVAIDPAYNGEVFNIALADVPERRPDLVRGSYDLEAPAGPATVAVKIIDMLGEEVLVVERV